MRTIKLTDTYTHTDTHTAVSSTYKVGISQGKENVNTQISGKVEIRVILGTYMQNLFEMYWRLKHKTWNYKTPTENIDKEPFDTGLGNYFLDITPKAQATKAKINK